MVNCHVYEEFLGDQRDLGIVNKKPLHLRAARVWVKNYLKLNLQNDPFTSYIVKFINPRNNVIESSMSIGSWELFSDKLSTT
jgi:hypothetical protein